MRVYDFDPRTRLFAGAEEIPDDAPLRLNQTAVPLDLADKRSPQHVFDGRAWVHAPRLYDKAVAEAIMAAREN